MRIALLSVSRDGVDLEDIERCRSPELEAYTLNGGVNMVQILTSAIQFPTPSGCQSDPREREVLQFAPDQTEVLVEDMF